MPQSPTWFGTLSTSQFIAIIIVVLCIAAYIVSKRVSPTHSPEDEDAMEYAEEEQKVEPESDTKVIFDADKPVETEESDSHERENN